MVSERRKREQEREARSPLVPCSCGCGEEIRSPDGRGRARRFVRGHSSRGRDNWWSRKDPLDLTSRSARGRARELKGPGPCDLEEIGGCSGWICVHHIDEDPWNNDLDNLLRLCSSHHALVHSGKVDLRDPVMPGFVVSGGTRRYEGTYVILPEDRCPATRRFFKAGVPALCVLERGHKGRHRDRRGRTWVEE